MKFYVSADFKLWVLGVKDPVANTYIDNATITATIFNPDGSTFATISSGAFSNVAGPKTINGTTYTDGIYSASIPNSQGFIAQTNYDLRVFITAGGLTVPFDGTVAAEYANLSGS